MLKDSMSYCDCESEAIYSNGKNFSGTYLNSLVMFT